MIKLCTVTYILACFNGVPLEVSHTSKFKVFEENKSQYLIEIAQVNCKTDKIEKNKYWVSKSFCVDIKETQK